MNPKLHYIFLRRLPQTLMWGGLEKIMMDWFTRIDYDSCRVTLAASPGGREFFYPRLEEKHLRIEIVDIPFDLYEGSTALFSDMFSFLKRLTPSGVVFVQGAHTDFRTAAVAGAFCAVGNNVYMHENLGIPRPYGYGDGHSGLWKQKLVNCPKALLCRKVVTLSRQIKYQLRDYWGYPQQKIAAIYHGIDLGTFHPSPDRGRRLRAELQIPADDYVFIATARLAKEKRLERVIEAFDTLARSKPRLWLLIVGDGDLRKDLQGLAASQQSARRVLFLGHREDVCSCLNAADCYVNTSDTEGLCIALLEAMACGLTCVATDCAGPAEILQDSACGFLVHKSVEDVCEGMQKALLLSVHERQASAARSIAFIRQNFELDKLAHETLSALGVPHHVKQENRWQASAS